MPLPHPTISLSDYLSVSEQDGIKIIQIKHPKVSASISLFGAHLLHFQPKGQEDFIWMSEKADFSGKTPLRGGIPLCWPWFGKSSLPSHGFARNAIWTLKEHRENENGVILSMILEDSPHTREIWPHAFHLEAQFEITEDLKVSLISTNTDKIPYKIGAALHTYLNIQNISDIGIHGLGEAYLERGESKTCLKEIVFDHEIDRIYTQPENEIILIDKAFERQIKITNAGHNAVVLWNPDSALSKQMQDMKDEGYKTMVCVESCIHDRSVLLQPGQKHTLSTSLSRSS